MLCRIQLLRICCIAYQGAVHINTVAECVVYIVEHMKFSPTLSVKLQEQIEDPAKIMCGEDEANKVPIKAVAKRKQVYEFISSWS